MTFHDRRIGGSSPDALPTPPDRSNDPHPLTRSRGWIIAVAGPAASLMILAAAAYQLRTIDFWTTWSLVPSSALFWACFAAYYLAAPVSEWLIFRRLWALPASGMVALLRKLVSNELLLGYSGEVYFYAWARRHARLVAAPFGAIKDVAILSAVAGNVFCLLMVIVAWPLLRALDPVIGFPAIEGSAIVVLVTSLAVLLFRRRLFTLMRSQLWWITAIHAARIVATAALAALLWHLLLPKVALGWWLVLGAARQILSRLPLVPNKDIAFAGVAALLVGGESEIAAAITLMASLILLAHLCVGLALAALAFARSEAA